jgi:hypothetical protein
MDYCDAKEFVQSYIQGKNNSALATVVKYALCSRIRTLDPYLSVKFAEIETATHIRKMLAEGEINSLHQMKRLVYTLSPERLPCP